MGTIAKNTSPALQTRVLTKLWKILNLLRSPVRKQNIWIIRPEKHTQTFPLFAYPKSLNFCSSSLHTFPHYHSAILYKTIMSLPHNESQTLQSHITPDPFQGTRRSTEFEMQAALILDENKFEYQSPADMIRIIQTTVGRHAPNGLVPSFLYSRELVKIFAKVPYHYHYYDTGCLDEES